MITKPIIPLFIVIPLLIIILVCYIISLVRRDTKLWKKIFGGIRIGLIVFLAFMINLRPMAKKYNAEIEMKNLDVLFVVDTTISMWAEDYDGNDKRMDGVIQDAEYIIDELSGSNFGLIRFDNRSQILAPFTQDHETIKDAFSTIKQPDVYYAKGSSLNKAYDDMKLLLESSSTKEDRLTIVFFMSDGEITDGSELMSFENLGPYVEAGAVMGYGTSKGGIMSTGDWGSHVKDPSTNKDAVSKIDEANLKQVASDLDIDYVHMNSTSNIKYMVDSIKNGSSLTIEKSDSVSYEDTYYKYAWPLLILLLLELVIFIRRGRL
ncbi:MAG: VWA domain-containing protein [Eubacterium sp.]|nr:VWA domain-containing protein [Eubacterium sp.]